MFPTFREVRKRTSSLFITLVGKTLCELQLADRAADSRAMAHAEALDRLARLVARAVKCEHAVIISLGGVGGRASVVDECAHHHGMIALGDAELLSHHASLFRRVREAREPLAVLDARSDDVAREWSPVTEGAVRCFIGMALVAPVQDGGADAGVVGVVGAYCCRPRSAPFEALELEAFRLTGELIAEKISHQLRELEEKVMMAEKMERMEKEKLELEEKMLEAERRAQVRLMAL